MATFSRSNSTRIDPQLAIPTGGHIRPLLYSCFFSVFYTILEILDFIIIRKNIKLQIIRIIEKIEIHDNSNYCEITIAQY